MKPKDHPVTPMNMPVERVPPQDVEPAYTLQYNYSLLPRGGAYGVADEVIAAYSPQCEGVEALRALRSRLTVGWLKLTRRRTLAVVSTERGEGRSWLAANLATLFAQAGFRTLLVDADLRNPRQHALFNLEDPSGLSGLLAGDTGHDIAHRVHEQLRLFVMPAGAAPANPQELLARPVFNALIDHYAEQFEVVLIDTPALAHSADAQLVCAHADAALMVVHRHSTRHARLKAAMKDLGQAGARVVASVLTEH